MQFRPLFLKTLSKEFIMMNILALLLCVASVTPAHSAQHCIPDSRSFTVAHFLKAHAIHAHDNTISGILPSGEPFTVLPNDSIATVQCTDPEGNNFEQWVDTKTSLFFILNVIASRSLPPTQSGVPFQRTRSVDTLKSRIVLALSRSQSSPALTPALTCTNNNNEDNFDTFVLISSNSQSQ